LFEFEVDTCMVQFRY